MKPYFSNPKITLYQADARSVPLADQSVHCVVTSPPYFGLRVYKGNDDRGIGLEKSVDAYLDNLMEVFSEVYRVLRDDGQCWVNIGDSYAASKTGSTGNKSTLEGGKTTQIIASERPDKLEMEQGNLLGIPWRFAFRMQEAGWILRQDVIWHKRAPMPESLAGTRWERCRVKVVAKPHMNGEKPEGYKPHGDTISDTQGATWADCPGCDKCQDTDGLVLRRGSWRCTHAHEYIFQFVKQMGYWSDGEAVKSAYKESSIERAQYPTNDQYQNAASGDYRGAYKGNGETRLTGGANRRSVWSDIKPEPYKGGHYATFPPGLPRLCIQASTSEAGACPSCGSQWARVIEKGQYHEDPNRQNRSVRNVGDCEQDGYREEGNTLGLVAESKTLGWRATCSCGDAQTVPSLVFDPFGGTGTTCVAAQRLGRRSVMTDLSKDYLQQAIARIQAEPLQTVKLF